MKRKEKDILILGIGNDILTDDGVGPKLCDYLRQKNRSLSVEFEKLNVGGIEILEFIVGYETVIFIDAIKTREGKVGDVYLYTPENFKETLHLSNLHDLSFITALRMGHTLGLKIPSRLFIIAVEIKEDMIFSDNFTEELEYCYEEVKNKVENLLNKLIYSVEPTFDKI